MACLGDIFSTPLTRTKRTASGSCKTYNADVAPSIKDIEQRLKRCACADRGAEIDEICAQMLCSSDLHLIKIAYVVENIIAKLPEWTPQTCDKDVRRKLIKQAARGRKKWDKAQECLATIAKTWGEEPIRAFRWRHKPPYFLDCVMRCALRYPCWDSAQTLLNQVVLERMARHGRGIPEALEYITRDFINLFEGHQVHPSTPLTNAELNGCRNKRFAVGPHGKLIGVSPATSNLSCGSETILSRDTRRSRSSGETPSSPALLWDASDCPAARVGLISAVEKPSISVSDKVMVGTPTPEPIRADTPESGAAVRRSSVVRQLVSEVDPQLGHSSVNESRHTSARSPSPHPVPQPKTHIPESTFLPAEPDPPSSTQPVVHEDLLQELKHKYGSKIEDVLQEMRACLEAINNAKSQVEDSQWEKSMRRVTEMLKDPKWAEIWTLEGSSLGKGAMIDKADVCYFTEEEVEGLIQTGQRFDRPFVIVPKHPGRELASVQSFLERLEDRYSNSTVDVQNQKHLGAISMEMSKVVDQVRKGQVPLTHHDAPLNLLNLRDIVETPEPPFLQHRRFQLIPTLHARAESTASATDERQQEQYSAAGKAAVTTVLAGRAIDLHSCRSFNIFAQKGCSSGCHVDILNGTYVHNIFGIKAWLILSGALTSGDRQAFEEQGAEWVPEGARMRIVLLRPGDTLVMPPGVVVVHAPLTVTDCLMKGGMFWDEHRIIDILENVLWAARSPYITNEPIPRQLPAVWNALTAFVKERLPRFASVSSTTEEGFMKSFTNVTEDMRRTISCECRTSTCKKGCKCQKSADAQEGRCTAWCHNGNISDLEKCVLMSARRRAKGARG